MLTVRAKFLCTSIVDDLEGGSKSITLHAVTTGSEENKEFFKWTPSGQLTLGCVNPEANALFEEGREYYIDFSKAEIEAVQSAADDQTTPNPPPPPKP